MTTAECMSEGRGGQVVGAGIATDEGETMSATIRGQAPSTRTGEEGALGESGQCPHSLNKLISVSNCTMSVPWACI